MIGGGATLSFWTRRMDLQGVEVWLPLALILSYGMSPLAGFIVAALIIVISWFMWPYQLQYVFWMVVCLAVLVFVTKFFPVSQASFIKTALTLTIGYNVVSNVLMLITGGNPLNIIKFAVISTLLSWAIYARVGWQLVTWLA